MEYIIKWMAKNRIMFSLYVNSNMYTVRIETGMHEVAKKFDLGDEDDMIEYLLGFMADYKAGNL